MHEPQPRDVENSHSAPETGETWDAMETELAGTSAEQPPELPEAPPPRPRRVRLPLLLFLATCLSTFWVGVASWLPGAPLEEALMVGSWMPVRRWIVAHGIQGLTYMGCVLAILLTHEMGHFLTTIRYRIPASFPYFIPLPISPIGTMGAVIGMDGMRANRKELFDIGIAGPLAGLVVALPIMWIGIQRLDLTTPPSGPYSVDMPLTMKAAFHFIQPAGYQPGKLVSLNQFNPFFMAGWVGLLITGLNMLPVSQLDGGHVAYTLMGRRAHWLARGVVGAAVIYTVVAQQYTWVLMIVLIFLVRIDHPPTRDDTVPLGPVRVVLGTASLLIPFLCFAPKLIIFR